MPPERGLRTRVLPLGGALPAVAWRWDAETDILSGGFAPEGGAGVDGTIEISGEDGAIAVLDVVRGSVAGLDIVVWPEVQTVRALHAPGEAVEGRVTVADGVRSRGMASFEVEAALTLRANPAETVYHLRVGEAEVARTVRIADHLFLELDAAGGIAGCWLTGVPPFPALDD